MNDDELPEPVRSQSDIAMDFGLGGIVRMTDDLTTRNSPQWRFDITPIPSATDN